MDREAPIDWQTRIHELAFTLKPYYGTKHLSFEEAQRTLQLQYLSTTLQTFRNQPTSGADPTAFEGSSNIQYPVVSANYTRLTVDPEGLVQNAATFTEDGGPSFWVSDEYGPYIHLLSKDGTVLKTIVPPDAVLPRNRNGQLDFTSLVDPVTGRCANQGFEGLTTSASGDKLYAFLQSALKQDGGGDRKTNRYTRLFMWDISAGAAGNATLEAEWIVPLPQSNKLETFAQSEIHWLNEHQFLVLARDGKGAGDDKPESSYKGVDVIDISSATNIANSVYDGATGAVTPGGQIVANVTPVTYTPFVQMIDKTQLSRFGLHNGKPADKTLIAAKWESLALVPVGDALYPDDYFLFTFADNDFQTKDGVSMGKPYTAGVDVDNQAMVWRVELPTVQRGSVETLIGV
ncbi:hypothetical protein FRB91_004257 [Serendipita sp. 411]|nr:hypothetical protein FRC15_001561 [Serendipita sp. 397]KAG8853865.1 hypothetical protein FRB91_004257 [Serendipita sp. 411]